MRSGLVAWLSLPAALFVSAQLVAAESTYDSAAAATRAEYAANAAKCRSLTGGARINCMKLAKAGAHAALSRTYGDAVEGAKAAHARTASKCKAMNGGERRRCIKAARAERAMALGKAEEIRGAPLAMGNN